MFFLQKKAVALCVLITVIAAAAIAEANAREDRLYSAWESYKEKVMAGETPETAALPLRTAVDDFLRNSALYRQQRPELYGVVEIISQELADNDYDNLDLNMCRYLSMSNSMFLRFQFYIIFVIISVCMLIVIAVAGVLFYYFKVYLKERNAKVSRAILKELERERARISAELHGSIWILDSVEGADEAVKIQMQAIKEIRALCSTLTPPGLDEKTLSVSLKGLCENFTKECDIPCAFICPDSTVADSIGSEKKTNVYRIVQEALANVRNHSQASRAVVVVNAEKDGAAVVVVQDDGVGFDMKAAACKEDEDCGHFGLAGMRRRADLIDASLVIQSKEGDGTVITLCVRP